jgi:hypothetical protein
MKFYKNVQFNLDQNRFYETYNSDEYDRKPIYCLYIKLITNKIQSLKITNIFQKLNKYKLEEMIVHKESVSNTKIH